MIWQISINPFTFEIEQCCIPNNKGLTGKSYSYDVGLGPYSMGFNDVQMLVHLLVSILLIDSEEDILH